MTLLERFRTQPRHKHPDPAVRLAYVGEIPIDDRDAIGSMAREDDDPRVRRAAVAKLMDPSMLGTIARDDPDEGVRTAAVSMLRDIALESFEGVGEAESVDALNAISDPKTLAHVAKSATRETVALRALSGIADARALGSVARHAALEGVRRLALDGLRELDAHGEILAVAMNSEFKDSALAAAELITARDELEQIAARAKNKSAAKRARTVIREADEAVKRAADEAAERQREEARAQAAAVAAAASAAAESAPVPVEEPSAAAREEQARKAEAEERAADEQRELARARERAEAEEAEHDRQRREARLAELTDESETAAIEADLSGARARLNTVRREWKDLSARTTVAAELESRFHDAEAKVAARETEARESDARARKEALARVNNLLARVESLAADEKLSLKAGERALLEVRNALASMPLLPTRQDFEDAGRRLKAVQSTLVPKVQEIRDAVEWHRWANVTVQEQLCERMEALRALEDPEAIAREVRELQGKWREAADVPRAHADRLWRRFKAAHDEVWARCETHFAAVAQERAENLARKTALCEKAEALSESSNWIRTAEDLKTLQTEWKAVGAVGRGQEKAVWDRFRSACDRFFTRRREDLVQRKTLWADNLEKKEALAARVEALVESTDWDTAAAEIKKLQGEWRTIGPVKKTRSEAVWLRFRGACDAFFARYADRHNVARQERIAAREAICDELERLVTGSPESSGDVAEAPADLVASLRGFRGRWQQEIAARGVDAERARALDQRFAQALSQVTSKWSAALAGTELDVDANVRWMEAAVKRMEDLAVSLETPGTAGAADQFISPSTRLAAMLKEALAANTIGGKVDDDTRLRAAAEQVREAQTAWTRIGLVSEDVRRRLNDRFQSACRRVMQKAGGTPNRAGGAGRAGRAGR